MKRLLALLLAVIMCLSFVLVSCNDDKPGGDNDKTENEGGDNTDGDNTGGDNTGGDNTGGDNTGGGNTGGGNEGGDNTGGDNTGGDNTGGDNTGGGNTGGGNEGGDNTGGDNTGGDNTGGDNTGGDNTGGDNEGGEQENDEEFTGITFASKTFDYDEEEHSIIITGVLPAGTKVTYRGGENGKNGATNVGVYKIYATVSAPGYKTLELSAVLTVASKEEALSVGVFGSKLYFQNALDNNELYTLSGSSLSKITRDEVSSMTYVGSDMFFISKGLFGTGIKYMDSTGKINSTGLNVKAGMLATDGTYIYYNVGGLLPSENTGIYRISVADLKNGSKENQPHKVTSAKGEYINVVGNYIYFSNNGDGGKLYAVRKDGNNAEPIKILDRKCTDIISDGGNLYFTAGTLLGSAIYRLDISGGLSAEVGVDDERVTKLTVSKGKYLTKSGDYIYFVNTDMLTSYVFGDGIYRTRADGNGISLDITELLTGAEKVIDSESDKFFALASIGNELYYYRTGDRHLYSYNTVLKSETDLMKNFVKPEENELITTYYEKTQLYGNEIYFINMKDSGKLYKYDIQTKTEYRLTVDQVADFAVYDGYIYYTTVKLFVNFDFYRVSLNGGEPELLSTEKCLDYSFDGNKIYYVNYSSTNTFRRMNTDGSGDELLYGTKVGSGQTTVYDGYVYFIADSDQLYRYRISDGTVEKFTDSKGTEICPLDYLIYDGKILVMNCKGFTNHIDIIDIETRERTELDSLGMSGFSDDTRGMFVYKGEMYYYRNVAAETSSKYGLYKVTEQSGKYSAVLVGKYDGYFICDSVVYGDKLYFIDVWQIKDSLPTTSSTADLCELDLETGAIKVLN